MTDPVTAQLAAVLGEIAAERRRQDAKFGEQNHRDGTGGRRYAQHATAARRTCQLAAADPDMGPHWDLILLEEVYEALAESGPDRLRAELVQVAAVCVAWCQAIDRRTATPTAPHAPQAPQNAAQDRPGGADETPGAPGALRGAQTDADGPGVGLRDRIAAALTAAHAPWFRPGSRTLPDHLAAAALAEVQPELDRLRDELEEVTALAATWEQRHGDLRGEHRGQARAWDRGLERAKERADRAEGERDRLQQRIDYWERNTLPDLQGRADDQREATQRWRDRADQAEARLAQAVRDLPERDLHDAIRRLAREDPAWLHDTIRRARFNAGSNTPAILGTPEEDHL